MSKLRTYIWVFPIAFGALIGCTTAAAAITGYPGDELCYSGDISYPAGNLAESVDRSLLDGGQCSLPCWQGITPGQSTQQDAYDTLLGLPFVESSSVINDQNSPIIAWVSAVTGRGAGMINTYQDKVRWITVRLEYPASLQALIDQMGTPDGYFVKYIPYGDLAPKCYSLQILWFRKGLLIETQLDLRAQALSTTVAESATYFEQGFSVNDYVASMRGNPDYASEFHEWEGISSITPLK